MVGELQKVFRVGDFKSAVKLSNDAVAICKQLPDPGSAVELTQLHLNMSGAFMHMSDIANAEIQCNLAVEYAEKVLGFPDLTQQGMELLSVALTAKGLWLASVDRADEGEPLVAKSIKIAEGLYGKSDPRLHKSVRAMGLIREKQGNIEQAEENMAKVNNSKQNQ